MTGWHGSLPRAGLWLEDEAASLRGGLAELGLGQEAGCLLNVEDRVDRELKGFDHWAGTTC